MTETTAVSREQVLETFRNELKGFEVNPEQVTGESSFDAADFMESRGARRSDRFTRYAVAAAVEGVEKAGWNGNVPFERDRVGVIIGSGIGGIETLEAQHRVLLERGPSKMSPFTVPLL